MAFGLPSEAASLAFLSILFALAFFIASARSRHPTVDLVPAACLNLALQALHVAEEFATGFHRAAPAMLGLEPWSASYFVSVNMAALALWALAVRAAALGRISRFWRAWLWFLAIASIGNAVWHPAASLARLTYFPGTATAPFLGVAGYLLARALAGGARGRRGA